jgi:hypothetical protein
LLALALLPSLQQTCSLQPGCHSVQVQEQQQLIVMKNTSQGPVSCQLHCNGHHQLQGGQ